MGISLDDSELLLSLDEGVALARSDHELPEVWVKRVERLGALGIKTYIAALGGALLAKATRSLRRGCTEAHREATPPPPC